MEKLIEIEIEIESKLKDDRLRGQDRETPLRLSWWVAQGGWGSLDTVQCCSNNSNSIFSKIPFFMRKPQIGGTG